LTNEIQLATENKKIKEEMEKLKVEHATLNESQNDLLVLLAEQDEQTAKLKERFRAIDPFSYFEKCI
jgi:hypothetical protein